MRIEVDPSPLVAAPNSSNQDHHEDFPATEGDTLQDYYQQAILSDGLQRIDERTYVVQDWDECFGILEVSQLVPHPMNLKSNHSSLPGSTTDGRYWTIKSREILFHKGSKIEIPER